MPNSIEIRILFVASLLLLVPANAAEVRIPWKADYSHNSNKHWSKDNPYDSGFSNNFNNGAPEEFGQVKKDGELKAEIILPKDVSGPIPFMIMMHGCDGLGTLAKEWGQRIADALNPEGFGVVLLDSYTTRYVDNSCGMPDLHWGRRRAEDAYAALDYLIEHKLAKPNEVYLMGQSNGGLATMVALSKRESDRKHRFAAGFPVVPSCISVTIKQGEYYSPMIIFAAEKDDANLSKYCVEMMKKKRSTPLQLIMYRGSDHGFMMKSAPHVFHGWHLSHNPAAENDMMQTIASALRTGRFVTGMELR